MADPERTEADAVPLPQFLIVRASPGLGGTEPTAEAYQRVGVLSFGKFYKSEEKNAADFIERFKDAEVERTQTV